MKPPGTRVWSNNRKGGYRPYLKHEHRDTKQTWLCEQTTFAEEADAQEVERQEESETVESHGRCPKRWVGRGRPPDDADRHRKHEKREDDSAAMKAPRQQRASNQHDVREEPSRPGNLRPQRVGAKQRHDDQ